MVFYLLVELSEGCLGFLACGWPVEDHTFCAVDHGSLNNAVWSDNWVGGITIDQATGTGGGIIGLAPADDQDD